MICSIIRRKVPAQRKDILTGPVSLVDWMLENVEKRSSASFVLHRRNWKVWKLSGCCATCCVTTGELLCVYFNNNYDILGKTFSVDIVFIIRKLLVCLLTYYINLFLANVIRTVLSIWIDGLPYIMFDCVKGIRIILKKCFCHLIALTVAYSNLVIFRKMLFEHFITGKASQTFIDNVNKTRLT